VLGERGPDRKARADQVLLDSAEGRALVGFVRQMADEFRTRLAGAQPVKGATVTLTFDDKIKVDGGAMMGDALKAGFTLGAATSATQAETFTTHIELTLDGPDGAHKTYACDAQEQGRAPKFMPTVEGQLPDTAEHERMYAAARRACLAQITAQIEGKPAPAPAAPAKSAS
jgi:hypothetical protein